MPPVRGYKTFEISNHVKILTICTTLRFGNNNEVTDTKGHTNAFHVGRHDIAVTGKSKIFIKRNTTDILQLQFNKLE